MLSLRINRHWIFVSLVFLLFTFPHSSFAAPQLQASQASRTIFDQTNDTYFGPPIVNATLNDAFYKFPETFATTVGMTLQRQKQYVHSHPKYFPQYKKLEEEAESFMKQVAQVHHYIHPSDGSPLPEERMLAEFLRGLNGDLNQIFIQKFGIDPAWVDLPLMLDQVPLPKNISINETMGTLQIKQYNDGPVLLGEEFKQYVPKENVKTNQLSTNDIALIQKDISHASPEKSTTSTTPTVLITDVILEPDPVVVNQAFDFHVKFKAGIPSFKGNKITTTFYFKILKKNQVLFKSEPYAIKVINNKIKTWTQHMNPVAAKGEYTLEVFINHKNLQAEKMIRLIIE